MYEHIQGSKAICTVGKPWALNIPIFNPPKKKFKNFETFYLVGGFNPFEKYESNWESSPNFRVKIKHISNHHPVIVHVLFFGGSYGMPVFITIQNSKIKEPYFFAGSFNSEKTHIRFRKSAYLDKSKNQQRVPTTTQVQKW